jgi:hypothetical protein
MGAHHSAAEQGNVVAQWKLAHMYATGKGLPRLSNLADTMPPLRRSEDRQGWARGPKKSRSAGVIPARSRMRDITQCRWDRPGGPRRCAEAVYNPDS